MLSSTHKDHANKHLYWSNKDKLSHEPRCCFCNTKRRVPHTHTHTSDTQTHVTSVAFLSHTIAALSTVFISMGMLTGQPPTGTQPGDTIACESVM